MRFDDTPYYAQMSFDFNEHVAVRKGNEIEFGIPGTGTFRMHFSILPKSSILVVWGDLGYAMYNWYRSELTFEGIAHMSIDYVNGKCVASKGGYRFQEWYPEKARNFIGTYLLENLFKDLDDLRDRYSDEVKEVESYADFEKYLEQNFNFEFVHEFVESLMSYQEIQFDCEDYDAGFDIDTECYIHLVGLKAAMKYLELHRSKGEKIRLFCKQKIQVIKRWLKRKKKT